MAEITPIQESIEEKLRPTHKPGIGAWLRNKFLTGLFVALPMVGTFWILNFIYGLINSRFEPLVIAVVTSNKEKLPALDWMFLPIWRNGQKFYTIPGAGFILTIAFVILLGIIVSNFLGRKIFLSLERMVMRLPMVSIVYNSAKQIIESLQMIGQSERMKASKVVFLAYPGINGKLVGFLSGQFQDKNGLKMCTVFLPTSPNPITGFVIVIPESEVEVSDLPFEEASKLIISGGLVTPRHFTYPPLRNFKIEFQKP